jgi:uncharacterized protein (DUF2236 family)
MYSMAVRKTLPLQWAVENWLDRAASGLLAPDDGQAIDFSRPAGEAALTDPASVSWRIFKNPVALFIGGVAAVILEFAEPRVRTGVWEHTEFRTDPARRIRRTGLAAMVTVYGPRSAAEAMIAEVRRLHDGVRGHTPADVPYSANDPELLSWVQATAAFGFLEAYHTYVAPLSATDRNRYYSEGQPAAALYGATGAPASEAEVSALFEKMRGKLEASPILFEFLNIVRKAPVLPGPLRLAQPLFVAAAVSLVPAWTRALLALPDTQTLRSWQKPIVSRAGAAADLLMLRSSPAVQSCLRMALPADYLYGGGGSG